MKKFLIDLIVSVLPIVFNAIISTSKILFGKKSNQEQKLKDKAKKDGWTKENTKLTILAVLCLSFLGCAPHAIIMQQGQSVMLAENKRAKCYVLADNGQRYKTTVQLKAGWICGPVNFEE